MASRIAIPLIRSVRPETRGIGDLLKAEEKCPSITEFGFPQMGDSPWERSAVTVIFAGAIPPMHPPSQGVNSPPELTPFYLQTRNGRPGSLASRPYAASRSFLSNPDCMMRIDRAS